MTTFDLGDSIPPHTAHAVSVSLPSWASNVGYEEGESWVVDRMVTGYPRFFIHRSITQFASEIVRRHGSPGQVAMLFPTPSCAQRCVEYIKWRSPTPASVEVVHLGLDPSSKAQDLETRVNPAISAVLCSPDIFNLAKEYWQHTGDGISSRRAEFCSRLFNERHLARVSSPSSGSAPTSPGKVCKGPRRYQRLAHVDAIPPTPASPSSGEITGTNIPDVDESSRFLEERFGRNLDISLVDRAKSAIRRRIAGSLKHEIDLKLDLPLPVIEENSRGIKNLQEDDVYLFPCGMNAIYHAHRALLRCKGQQKSISYGFPYVDTLKILQKFGPGCVFYGHASDSELDELQGRLQNGERFLALFCEFPGNPLLTCPDLARIRRLADEFDFAVVVDETIGTFVNVNVLQYADIVVSSLTKIFSGDCNVMGGSAVLNPNGRYYHALKSEVTTEFEDTYWAEDVIFMERNSRDFVGRIERININAEAICKALVASPLVSRIYYPRYNASRPSYEAVRVPSGGYGGLLSVTFYQKEHAVAFYDALETAKGPSLGTNFTLTSPYVVLAHYAELDWAQEYGVDPNLLRISVGLEDTESIVATFNAALKAAATLDQSGT